MINANYLQLQQQIADELGDRTDLLEPLGDSGLATSPIQNAIQSAIAKWEREPFWFSETYTNVLINREVTGPEPPFFFATPLQEFYGPYTAPTTLDLTRYPKISKLSVLVNNNRYSMNPRTWGYLEDISVNPSVRSSFPYDYALFGGLLRLYPIPAEIVPINATFYSYLAPLVEPTDSNAWTTIAYDLIRSEAKLILALEVLFDDDIATRMKTAIYGDVSAPFVNQINTGYLASLRRETSRRQGGSKLRPSHF